jgi:hypothetical protein
MPIDAALTELRRCSGTQFDPAVVTTRVQVVDVGHVASVHAAASAALVEATPA